MTTYTEATANPTLFYDEDLGIEWDLGATSWDVVGNVATTHWDITTTAYTEASNNTATWTLA
jgi:hypothetical protein